MSNEKNRKAEVKPRHSLRALLSFPVVCLLNLNGTSETSWVHPQIITVFVLILYSFLDFSRATEEIRVPSDLA